MTRKITNLLGIIITILAGIWYFMMLCSECSPVF
jgi:flagellar biogenesis protein FliO